MRTDGLFTVHSHTIPVRSNQPFRLIFFGDVHRDSPNHANRAWQDFLEYASGLDNAWYFGMGDYLDSTSTSERSCLGKITQEMHETFLADVSALQDAKVELMAKELKFMKGKLIGLLNGNHYFSFSDGTNSDQRLCRMLDCKYLGVSSFVRISLDDHGRAQTLDIWVHHGTGAGRLLGGSINRVDQMREHAEADIYAMGDDHKRAVVPATPRLHLARTSRAGLKVKHRQQWLIRSGSFLASYEPGVRNYNVDAARGPCSLGHVELIVTMVNHSKHDKIESEIAIRGLS